MHPGSLSYISSRVNRAPVDANLPCPMSCMNCSALIRSDATSITVFSMKSRIMTLTLVLFTFALIRALRSSASSIRRVSFVVIVRDLLEREIGGDRLREMLRMSRLLLKNISKPSAHAKFG